MKRTLLIAMCAALLAGIAGPAMAQQAGLDTSGTVSLNYWMADLDADFAGTSDSADQSFFPALTAVVTFSNNWGAMLEYEDSGSDTGSSGVGYETSRYLFGVRYDFESGWYANLSYTNMDTDWDFGALGTGGLKVDGFRLGGGIDYPFEGTPWTMTADLGLGISPDASGDISGTASDGDGEELDFTLGFSYRFNEEGLLGDIGYKHARMEGSFAGGTIEHELDGFFLGVGYEWK